MKIVSVVGRKNTGKTSLTIKIIEELTKRGYKVGSIKHSHHNLKMDRENTDTWRHKQAGSSTVIGIGETSYFNVCEDIDLDRLLFLIKILNPVDFVVIEGFKNYPYPQIATSEDVINDSTIKYVDSFKITSEELIALVDLIELRSHDIINTLYADNCGLSNANNISQEIINGKISSEDIDQVDTFLSVNGKVVGLNKFINNYLKEITLGIIKTLNLEQFGVEKLENIQIFIENSSENKKLNMNANDEIKLFLNDKDIYLNEFASHILINTIFSMLHSLKVNSDTFNDVEIKIDEETLVIINGENIPLNKFVKKMIKETINGMIKSLKTKKYGIEKIEKIEITIKN